MNRHVKAAMGRFAFATGLYQRYFRDVGIIILFHRVDDRYPGNPITCSRREFTDFLDFVQEYFDVVSMSAFIAKLNSGGDISRNLVINFDDGYRDNRRAADELRRRQLPATFFIATDFIGTNRVPWWDEEAKIASEWMTWDEVRSLHTDGFELGAHTRNHIDLGVITGREAEEEIIESRERLAREIGAPISLFSYPFGRAHQMTEANREFVKRSGFICCPSAFGGNVHKGDSPFTMCRTPFSPWVVSPYQLGFEAMRER